MEKLEDFTKDLFNMDNHIRFYLGDDVDSNINRDILKFLKRNFKNYTIKTIKPWEIYIKIPGATAEDIFNKIPTCSNSYRKSQGKIFICDLDNKECKIGMYNSINWNIKYGIFKYITDAWGR